MQPSEVAWQGPVQMVEAKWTDKDGSLVRLKLLEVDEEQRNPFVKFTKRRGDRAGTRFQAALVDVDTPHMPIYNDEIMLAGWNDSQNGGMSVTLWLAQDRMGHPFEGVSRKTVLQLVLVELDEAQEPIDQKVRDRVEAAGDRPRRPSERPSYAAAMLCKNPDFWEWVQGLPRDYDDLWVTNEDTATAWLRYILKIASRGELDRNDELARVFQKKIQFPFSTWVSGHTSKAYDSSPAPSVATHG